MSTIGLVCIGNPRLLEYCLWIIDAMYGDGFMTDQEEESTLAITANVSALDGNSTIATQASNNNFDEGVGVLGPVVEGVEGIAEAVKQQEGVADDTSSLGLEIDLASTITQPSVDLEGKNKLLNEDIKVNLGDPDEEYSDVFPNVEFIAEKKEGEDLTEIVVDGEVKLRQAREKKKALIESGAVKAELGESLYEYRFKRRPRDPIVLFCAMCSAHFELPDAERRDRQKVDWGME